MEQIIDDTQRNPSRRWASTSIAVRNFNLPLTARSQAQLPGSSPNALR